MERKITDENNTYMLLAKQAAERSRCKKMQIGTCLATKDGKFIIGNNDTEIDIEECPRKDLPTGKGYERCKDICKQNYHAEASAIENARKIGLETLGSVLFLYGHWYCCDLCLGTMEKAGVIEYYVLPQEFYKKQIQKWGRNGIEK